MWNVWKRGDVPRGFRRKALTEKDRLEEPICRLEDNIRTDLQELEQGLLWHRIETGGRHL